MAIALPRKQRWQRQPAPRWLIVAFLAAVGVIGFTAYGRLPAGSSFITTSSITSQDAPSVRVALSSASYGQGQVVSGAITVSTTSAVTVRDLTVSIFPVGARRPGIDEESVRTRALTLPISDSLGANASARYGFTWDRRTDAGTLAPLGEYVLAIRVSSTIDRGDAHATLTLAGNEPVIELR